MQKYATRGHDDIGAKVLDGRDVRKPTGTKPARLNPLPKATWP
jgi:hypothetical protein